MKELSKALSENSILILLKRLTLIYYNALNRRTIFLYKISNFRVDGCDRKKLNLLTSLNLDRTNSAR